MDGWIIISFPIPSQVFPYIFLTWCVWSSGGAYGNKKTGTLPWKIEKLDKAGKSRYLNFSLIPVKVRSRWLYRWREIHTLNLIETSSSMHQGKMYGEIKSHRDAVGSMKLERRSPLEICDQRVRFKRDPSSRGPSVTLFWSLLRKVLVSSTWHGWNFGVGKYVPVCFPWWIEGGEEITLYGLRFGKVSSGSLILD